MVKYFYLLTALFGLTACGNAQDCVGSKTYDLMLQGLLEQDVPSICVDSAKTLSKALFLDARELGESAVSTIQGAIAVGYENFKVKQLKNLPKDTLVVVYCSVGYRSEKVAKKLIDQGFTNVYNLYGGIFEWVNKGYPVYQDSTATLKVHA